MSVSTIYIDQDYMFVGGKDSNLNNIIRSRPLRGESQFTSELVVDSQTSLSVIDPGVINEFFRHTTDGVADDTYAITDKGTFLSSY